MAQADNKHWDSLRDYTYEPFRGMFVEQVIQARGSVFDEMCKEMNVVQYGDVRAKNMAKKTITREKLTSWLETVCFILDSCAVPLLEKGVDVLRTAEELKSEKVTDQKTIIELQGKLIDKREEELAAVQTSVQTTVKSEMQSYSSAVTKSCAAALAPKRIHAAVQKVAEKEDRDKNVIIYGVEEKSGEQPQDKLQEILTEINEKPLIKDCCRVGLISKDTISNSRPRPIKFTLNGPEQVRQVLRNSKLLRTKEGYKSIYLCPDRTADERKAFKKLIDQLAKKRDSEPDKVHFITNNKIISSDKDSVPPGKS